jgi:hypothetical protein
MEQLNSNIVNIVSIFIIEHKAARDKLLTLFESTNQTKANIMNQTKSTVDERMSNEAKLLKW